MFERESLQKSLKTPRRYAGSSARADASDELAAHDASKWCSRRDEASAKEYYYNSVTNVTTWRKPACVAAADVADALAERLTVCAVSPQPQTVRSETSSSSRESCAVVVDCVETPVAELAACYADHEFDKFALANFQLYRKGMFKSKTEVGKMTRWKNELIKTPMLNLKDADSCAVAVQNFRNVTGFMGDRGSGKAGIDHCVKILKTVLHSESIELRDECYCQIVKQVTENPSPESTARGWQLFAVCLGTFPPSEQLAPHLGWFCGQTLTQTMLPVVREYAEFCLRKLPLVRRLGARTEPPTQLEVEATQRMAKASVRVFFLDGKSVTLPADSWTTCEQFCAQVADALGIKTPRPFALFQARRSTSHPASSAAAADAAIERRIERVLDKEERVLELVAAWHRLSSSSSSSETPSGKVGKSSLEQGEFHFCYKVRHFLDVPDSDVAAVELVYVQATHDVVRAHYPSSPQDAITLAALQVQEELGDVQPASSSCTSLRDNLATYLSEQVLARGDAHQLEEQLLRLYTKLAGYSQNEARLSYLDYVKSWKIYGSSYFRAEPKQNRDFPNEVVLAINAKGILVVDPITKDFLQEYPYSQVVTWGHSANSFVVVTGDAQKQVKVYFKTDQGSEMNVMVRAYVEALMA